MRSYTSIVLIGLLAFGSQCQAFHETFSESWEERWIYSSTLTSMSAGGVSVHLLP